MTDLDTKRCARCCLVQTIDAFPLSKQTRDGLFPYCRECKRIVVRESAAKYREATRISDRARYAANPEPYKARSRKRYRKDPARWKAEASAWVKANPEKRKVSAAAWQQKNMQGVVREYTRRRYATRKGAVAIKFSPEQLRQRMAYWGDRCWCCGGPQDAIDHVKPLSKGGAHMLCNLRPICKPCNSSKSDKWPLHGARVAS